MNSPTRSGPPAPRDLSEVLELEQLDTNLFRSRVNQINRNRSLFGGQILGQGLKAAALTVDGARTAHSLHGYFLLAGMSDIPVIYDVELTRDGGSFSTRRVLARQRAKPIFHMELSFHREEKGFEHDIDLDIDVPDPEQLLSLSELAQKFAGRLPQDALPNFERDIVEMKPVSPEDFFMRKSDTSRGLYWIRSLSKLPDDPLTQQAALAYLSDYFLTSTVVLKHTISMMSGEVMMASLDHAMWFHRPARADEWVLVDTLSPFAGGARGFTRGAIFDRNRKLIASVAQEGLVRPISK
ncbi:MAG TPA: acyl-CoA thioesterase II [Steroidobacteraceae bacterium]|nr:acyl-CoA thioesterase II [Steroidobacteraceae bacterium]